MSGPSPFGLYWDNLVKHHKRVHHWLPSVQQTLETNGSSGPARVLTLSSREMIDAFLLVTRGLVTPSPDGKRIPGVYCFECDGPAYVEVGRMVGVPEQVFFGKVEDLVLSVPASPAEHEDRMAQIDALLANPDIPDAQGEALRSELRLLHMPSLFPFDFINLDFCECYYSPPDVMKIHAAVRSVLSWQAQAERWTTFSIAVTSRHGAGPNHHDDPIPAEAVARLLALAAENMRASRTYPAALSTLKGVEEEADLVEWAQMRPLDFYASLWPKHVLSIGLQHGWGCGAEAVTHYERYSEEDGPYAIVATVLRFTRASPSALDPRPEQDYATQVTRLLNPSHRPGIPDISPDSAEGKALLRDLEAVWKRRNRHARRRGVAELPKPDPRRSLTRVRRARGKRRR